TSGIAFIPPGCGSPACRSRSPNRLSVNQRLPPSRKKWTTALAPLSKVGRQSFFPVGPRRSPSCHSEERSDEESAFGVKNRRSRFLSHPGARSSGAQSARGIGMTGRRTFMIIGGPMAHVTLRRQELWSVGDLGGEGVRRLTDG